MPGASLAGAPLCGYSGVSGAEAIEILKEEEITTLEGLLDSIVEANEGRDEISIGEVLQAIGSRSFGPLLMIPGLIAFSPLSGIPGMPTTIGVMVLLITSQLLLGRSEISMPQFVTRRAVSRARFEKAIRVLRKVARVVDRLIKPRLTFLTAKPITYTIAVLFLLLSLIAPLMELLPFVISAVGGALSAYGLALVAHDGLLALIAMAFCAGTLVIAGAAFL